MIEQVKTNIASPCLEVIENERDADRTVTDFAGESVISGMFWCNTIVSLTCRVPVVKTVGSTLTAAVPPKYRRLKLAELKQVHKLMSQNIEGKIDFVDANSPASAAPDRCRGGRGIGVPPVSDFANASPTLERRASELGIIGVELAGPHGTTRIESMADVLKQVGF